MSGSLAIGSGIVHCPVCGALIEIQVYARHVAIDGQLATVALDPATAIHKCEGRTT